MSLLQEKLTVLVNSCDAYEELWIPFFTLYKKYGGRLLQSRLLLSTETKTFQYPGLSLTCVNLPRRESDAPYGRQILHALEQVKTEYVLCTLDDFLFRAPVDTKRLEQILAWMDADRDIAYFNCDATVPCAGKDDLEKGKYPGYIRLPRGNAFTLNMQLAVWRTARLKALWRPNVTPWEWEGCVNVLTANDKKDKFYCLQEWDTGFAQYGPHGGCIYKGRWIEEDIVPLCQKENLTIDFTRRGFLSAENGKPHIDANIDRVRRYDRIVRCLGYRYLLPYFIFCRRCNLYSHRYHCAVDENYFNYLQRKAEIRIKTGRKVLFGPMQT